MATKTRHPEDEWKEESHNRAGHTTTTVERPAQQTLAAQEKDCRFSSPVCITVTSYRKAISDTDGVSVKAFLDGLVKIGLLEDDSCKQVKEVRFKTIILPKGGKEKTILEIEETLSGEEVLT